MKRVYKIELYIGETPATKEEIRKYLQDKAKKEKESLKKFS